MGGHQANPAQASAANAGATTAANQNTAIGSTAASTGQNLYGNMFGSSNGSGGTSGGQLSSMTNPSSMNVTAPTGTYLQQYNTQAANTANSFQQQRGALAQSLANRGFGTGSPAYFGAQQQQQLNATQAQTQGQEYTSATQAQQQQAIQNFWNAQQMQATAAGQNLQSGVAATQAAGSTFGNLYGTAGQYVNPLAQDLQGIGSIASAGTKMINPISI